jgi:PhzF family phenazine biosynthesis protein
MGVPLLQVDAFTAEPFAGNPAAVCLLDGPRDDRWLQRVASEMNLSETAFLLPEGDAFRLRWFTPTVEVALCGHATLASAQVLWQRGVVAEGGEIRFLTRSGSLFARREGPRIELDFPSTPPRSADAVEGLAQALGVAVGSVWRSRSDVLVRVGDEPALRALKPDFAALRRVEARGVIVTARSSDARFDFVSRFFAPAVGVDEDPVTGSAHCCLAPYWANELGSDRLVGFQASARGGIVHVRVAGDRVILGGEAVTVMRGELGV